MLDVLRDWSINFVKHKDVFTRNLIDFRVEKNIVEFNFKDKKHFFVSIPLLDNSVDKHLKDNYITIVCLNKKENLNYLKVRWKDFIKDQKLNFIFVNPNTNEKWLINPNIHERISDEESFSEGLNSMFESVREVE